MPATFILRFVKNGQTDVITKPISQSMAFELIRDYVSMAWILISIETVR